MGKKNVTVETIQQEAREGYSLFERLAEASHRTKTVTVYTNQKLGAELGYAVDGEDMGIKTGMRVRKGLIGELDELKERAALVAAHGTDEEVESVTAEIDKAKKTITARVKKLQKEMQNDALVFTLQSLPKIARKVAIRDTRKALSLKGNIPESRIEEYNEELTYHMLAASVLSWEDRKVGKKFSSLTVEEARNLDGMLPPGQFPILDAAIVELSYEVQIHNAAVDNVDFS